MISPRQSQAVELLKLALLATQVQLPINVGFDAAANALHVSLTQPNMQQPNTWQFRLDRPWQEPELMSLINVLKRMLADDGNTVGDFFQILREQDLEESIPSNL